MPLFPRQSPQCPTMEFGCQEMEGRMGCEDGRMSLVKPRLWLLGLFRLLLVWVTAGHGKNMQKEALTGVVLGPF